MSADTIIGERFFDANKPHLEMLFEELGRISEWNGTVERIIDYTQEQWVGNEHGNSSEKDQFTLDQERRSLKVLAAMGFTDEILPATGHYEQVVVVCGLMRVNRQRIGFMKQYIGSTVTTDKVVFLAGQRLRDDREDTELQAVNLEKLYHHDWVRKEASKPLKPGENSRFATEADLTRLAFLEKFPEALQTASDSPKLYNFGADSFPPVTILNAPKVERPRGDARHTTASSTEELLRTIPPSNDARILLVDGNPHIKRDLRVIRQTAAEAGRSDIEFTVSGPAANPLASVQLYLGEVGRLLYMDTQAQASA